MEQLNHQGNQLVKNTKTNPKNSHSTMKPPAHPKNMNYTLKETLQSRGYLIVDEFGCAGFNTNKFLKRLGGLNKGRPNAEDLKHAEDFARKLKQ